MAISSAGGKGSSKRPSSVSMEVVDANFEQIFGKNEKETKCNDSWETKIDKMCQRLLDSEEHAVEAAIPPVAEEAVQLLMELKNEVFTMDRFVRMCDIDMSKVTPRSQIAGALESAAMLLMKNQKGKRDGSAHWRIRDALIDLENLMKK